VAGLVADELERMPQPGDSVTVGEGTVLAVLAMDGLRVDRIRLTPAGEPSS